LWTKPERDSKSKEAKTSLTTRQILKKYRIRMKPITPSKRAWGQTPKDKERDIHRLDVFFYGVGG